MSSSVAPVARAIPDVSGQDAASARRSLEELGLAVTLSSANPKYSTVTLASNWMAVSIQPPPGTVVNPGYPVVVRVYKE